MKDSTLKHVNDSLIPAMWVDAVREAGGFREMNEAEKAAYAAERKQLQAQEHLANHAH